MANKRVRDNAALLYTGVASGDIFFIDDLDANEDKKITAAELKKYILENGTIGGTTAGDIADIDSAQTLTNKRLTAPGINSANPITANSAEFNKLAGCTASTAELNLMHTYAAKIPYLANVTGDIQNQIDAINSLAMNTVYSYGERFTASGSGRIYAGATIMSDLGLDSGNYGIDPNSIVVSISSYTGGTFSLVSGYDTIQIDWTEESSGGVIILDNIKLSGLTNLYQYGFAFTFKIIEIAGV